MEENKVDSTTGCVDMKYKCPDFDDLTMNEQLVSIGSEVYFGTNEKAQKEMDIVLEPYIVNYKLRELGWSNLPVEIQSEALAKFKIILTDNNIEPKQHIFIT